MIGGKELAEELGLSLGNGLEYVLHVVGEEEEGAALARGGKLPEAALVAQRLHVVLVIDREEPTDIAENLGVRNQPSRESDQGGPSAQRRSSYPGTVVFELEQAGVVRRCILAAFWGKWPSWFSLIEKPVFRVIWWSGAMTWVIKFSHQVQVFKDMVNSDLEVLH